MINFLFKYYLNKKNFHKIFSSDLTQSQLEEIYHCYDNSNNKVNDKKKLIEDHIENELFQKLVYDDPELDINYKIKVLKDCNNNPFLKMSSNEIDELIKSTKLTISSVITLVNIRKEYEKLDLLKENINFKEDDKQFSELSSFEKTILLIADSENWQKLSDHRPDIYLLSQTEGNYNYELLLNNEKLKELFISNLVNNFTYNSLTPEFLYGEFDQLTDQQKMFVDTVFTDKKFIEEFYNDTIFSGPVRYEIVYKYLPSDKRFYVSYYDPYKFGENNDTQDHLTRIKKKYKDFYPEMKDETIELLTKYHCYSNNTHMKDINVLLKKYEKDRSYLDKIFSFLNKMDLSFLNFDILKIITSDDNYKGLIDYVISNDISQELKEKIIYLIKLPKLNGIDSIIQINNMTLEDIRKKQIEINKFEKRQSLDSPNGFYSKDGKSISNEGSHGIISIDKDGNEKHHFGLYHEECASFLYSDESKTDSLYENILFGLSKKEIVMLVEGDTTRFICNNTITKQQLDKVINMIEMSNLNGQLKFFVDIANNEDANNIEFISLNNGDTIDETLLIENLRHLKIIGEKQEKSSITK